VDEDALGRTSALVARLSPTSFQAMRACPLRIALNQELGRTAEHVSLVAALGSACHHVLQTLVTTGQILEPIWESRLDAAWHAESRASPVNLASAPGYSLKLARLSNVAHRVREILLSASDPQVLAEVELVSRDGVLHGWPDLIIRSTESTTIVDYKSGRILETTSMDVRPTYREQLQLCAYLEAEATDRWPSRALLLPFDGPPCDVPIIRSECEHLADVARSELSQFNDRVPNAQPDHADAATCIHCPWSCACPAFWRKVDASWEPKLVAARGEVVRCAVSALGGITIDLKVKSGTVSQDAIVVRAIDPMVHPAARFAATGKEISAVALRHESERDTYAAVPWTRILVGGATAQAADSVGV
jgi:hypothetical protein